MSLSSSPPKRRRIYVSLLLVAIFFLETTVASSFVPHAQRSSSFSPSTASTTWPQKSRFLLAAPTRGGDSMEASDNNVDAGMSLPSDTSSLSAALSPLPDTVTTMTTTTTTNVMMGPNAPPPGWCRRTFPSFPWHRLPNFLTYARCLTIPALVMLFYLPSSPRSHVYTGTLFALASVTDWWDGYLARRWDISTPFGAFLDPVADKLMVSTSLVLLSGRLGAIVAVPTLIILAREIAVSALREWMAQRGERNLVKVGFQGKVKTALTMVALTVLLYVPAGVQWTTLSSSPSQVSSIMLQIGIVMLYLCSLVTVTSGSVYFIAAGPSLLPSVEKKDQTKATA